MLLGYPASGSVTASESLADFLNYYGMFIQDDFRVSSKLTLNFGVRSMSTETGIQGAQQRLHLRLRSHGCESDSKPGSLHLNQRRDRVRRTEWLRNPGRKST